MTHSATSARIPLPGSTPNGVPTDAPAASRDRARQHVEATIVVRSRRSDAEWKSAIDELAVSPPRRRRCLSTDELETEWGADPGALEQVRQMALQLGLEVTSVDTFARAVNVAGRLDQFARAFDLRFVEPGQPGGPLTHDGPVCIPQQVAPVVESVLGLDTLPAAERHLVMGHHADPKRSMHPRRLRNTYQFPKGHRGQGQCIAVISLGGGFHATDLETYFAEFGEKPPRIVCRSILGGNNEPAPPRDVRRYWETLSAPGFDPRKPADRAALGAPDAVARAVWTIETTMDLSVIGSLAHGVRLLLCCTENSYRGQYAAFTNLLGDAEHSPSVISCSWGSGEFRHTEAIMATLDRWFQAAALLGVTICFSTGDAGDGSGGPEFGPAENRIEFPASSPHVLACGGTSLFPVQGREEVWQEKLGIHMPVSTGGGFSRFFDLPTWQREAGIDPSRWTSVFAKAGSGRGIPDVAAKANFQHAFSVVAGGIEIPTGGTSHSAPMWAALVAVLNEAAPARCGLLGPLLYSDAFAGMTRDIVEGQSGLLQSAAGWDPCTGWGSPLGTVLLEALTRTDD